MTFAKRLKDVGGCPRFLASVSEFACNLVDDDSEIGLTTCFPPSEPANFAKFRAPRRPANFAEKFAKVPPGPRHTHRPRPTDRCPCRLHKFFTEKSTRRRQALGAWDTRPDSRPRPLVACSALLAHGSVYWQHGRCVYRLAQTRARKDSPALS